MSRLLASTGRLRFFVVVLACLVFAGLMPAFAAAATISGTVTSSVTGLPLAGAWVQATLQPDAWDTIEDQTGADGTYTLAGLEAGQWAITAWSEGYRFSQVAEVVVGAEDIPLDIQLSPSVLSVSGSVKDAATNAPLGGAISVQRKVGVEWVDESPVPCSGGSFAIYDLVAGSEYKVVASSPGYNDSAQSFVFAGTPLTIDFTLTRLPVGVSGVVRDANTLAPLAVDVELQVYDAGYSEWIYESNTSTNPGSGAYSFSGLTGGKQYRIHVGTVPGYLNHDSAPFVYAGSPVVRDVAMTRPPLGLSGTVKNTAGDPLVGAVTLWRFDESSEWIEYSTVMSAANGYYEFRGLTGGTVYRASVSVAGYLGKTASSFTYEGSPRTYDFALVADTVADSSAPSSTLSGSPEGWASAWLRGDVTLTFTANDGTGSGVAERWYRLGGATAVLHDGLPIVVSAEGQTTVEYWSVDNVGNTESPHKFATVRIDRTPPTTTSDAKPTYSGMAVVHLSRTDALSGPKQTYWRLGTDGDWTAGTTVTTSVLGEHVLQFYSQDNAGNDEEIRQVAFVVEAPGAVAVERLAGRNRYASSVAIAREQFDADPVAAGTQWELSDVIVACGEDRALADPLAAAGVCGAYNAPLLLTASSAVDAEVRTAIQEMAAAAKARGGSLTVHLIGGTGVVPDARFVELQSAVGSSGTLVKDRISGANRYGTAAAIAQRVIDVTGVTPDVALVANGAELNKFSDALALSPIAAAKGFPLLLVQPDGVPSATSAIVAQMRAAGGAKRIIIGGGANTVSDGVKATLAAERWAGRSRYDTAIAVADGAKAEGWLSSARVGVAAKLPDALAGGACMGLDGGVLVLTDGSALTPATATWFDSCAAHVAECHVFGGEASVSSAVIAALQARID